MTQRLHTNLNSKQMKLESVHSVSNVQSTHVETRRYEQWVNAKNNKFELRVIVYSVDLYTKQGQAETHTNQHNVDVSV
jgi:hypothetical protein